MEQPKPGRTFYKFDETWTKKNGDKERGLPLDRSTSPPPAVVKKGIFFFDPTYKFEINEQLPLVPLLPAGTKRENHPVLQALNIFESHTEVKLERDKSGDIVTKLQN